MTRRPYETEERNAMAHLIERDNREKKKDGPHIVCEPPRPSSYRALMMASLVRHLAYPIASSNEEKP